MLGVIINHAKTYDFPRIRSCFNAITKALDHEDKEKIRERIAMENSTRRLEIRGRESIDEDGEENE